VLFVAADGAAIAGTGGATIFRGAPPTGCGARHRRAPGVPARRAGGPAYRGRDRLAARRWDAAALAHLASAGIGAERHVTRMGLGTPPRWRPETIFGVFNFGVG
jgi:hypothetical protein